MVWILAACSHSSHAPPDNVPTDGAPWADPARWLCRPDQDDPCDGDLDYTAVAADGSTEVVGFEPAADPPADCFYVYPTTSLDPTPQANLVPGPEEDFVVAMQAARYGAVCRVFAPMYRQVSVNGLFASSGDWDLAYDDVRAAFHRFVAHDLGDRPFLLIGHSQGSGHLQRLIAEEIEGDPALADRMVAAHLLGGFIEVPEGADVGGSFASTPLCRSDTETGCVVHYNTYRADDPPPSDSVFARSPTPGMQIGCTNPAALDGGDAPLGAVLPLDVPAEVSAVIGAQPGPYADKAASEALDTAFYSMPGLVHGACAEEDDASFLAITVDGDPSDPRADDIGGDFLLPGWGLHLVDISVAQLDLVNLAGREIESWTSSAR